MTEASAGGGMAQHRRSIREQRQRASEQTQAKAKKPEEGKKVGEHSVKQPTHAAILLEVRTKNR